MKRFRSVVLLLCVLSLAACGFRPIYGSRNGVDGSPVAQDLNNIAIENIPDRRGQMLRNKLVDRLYSKNRPSRSAYLLSVMLNMREEDMGILADASATRALIDMTAEFVLTDRAGKTLFKGTAHSVASFNKLDQMYASVAVREDIYQRTINEIAEQIVNRLGLYFSER